FELGVKLTSQEPWMVRQFDHLDELSVGRLAGEHQPPASKLIFEARVELVTVAMALADLRGTVNLFSERSRLHVAGICAQPHRPAERLYSNQISELEYDRMRSVVIKLGRVR